MSVRPTGANNGLMLANNLEDLAEAIGGYLGIATGLDRAEYMDAVLTRAHRSATRKFNEAAALSAKSKNFTHMYEYGTAGITPGQPTLKPTHQSARLWVPVIRGKGSQKVITYAFRPATRPVPPKKTGAEDVGDIDQDVLDKLKVNTGAESYIWKTKAADKELGRIVWIRPRGAKKLLVPTVQEPEYMSATEEKRGYAFRKIHSWRLDEAHSYGQFGGFFFSWWSTLGPKAIEQSMLTKVNADVREFAKKQENYKRGALKPASVVMVDKRASEEFRKTVKQWRLKAEQVAAPWDEYGAERSEGGLV